MSVLMVLALLSGLIGDSKRVLIYNPETKRRNAPFKNRLRIKYACEIIFWDVFFMRESNRETGSADLFFTCSI